jgi:hypothetical protein
VGRSAGVQHHPRAGGGRPEQEGHPRLERQAEHPLRRSGRNLRGGPVLRQSGHPDLEPEEGGGGHAVLQLAGGSAGGLRHRSQHHRPGLGVQHLDQNCPEEPGHDAHADALLLGHPGGRHGHLPLLSPPPPLHLLQQPRGLPAGAARDQPAPEDSPRAGTQQAGLAARLLPPQRLRTRRPYPSTHAVIYNVYQFTGIQDTEDYALDDLADQYTFYIAVEVIVSLVALGVQIRHFKTPFLRKSQLILVATLAAVFQFGSFILMAIKAVQFHLDIALMQDGNCYWKDCDEAGVFRWELTGYSILTFLVLAAQVPYFSVISNIAEREEKRDTLITEENYQA